MKLLKKTSFVFYCFCLGWGGGRDGIVAQVGEGSFLELHSMRKRQDWAFDFLFDTLHAMGSPPTFDLKEDKPFLTIQNQDSETTICQAVVCCCVKATLMTYIV